MIAKINISSRLYLLLAFSSLVIIISGGYGIWKLKEMNTITQTIHNDRLMPMKQLFIIRNAYGIELLSIVTKVNTQQISSQQAITELTAIEQAIRSNWKSYQLTRLATEEVHLIQQISPLMQEEDRIIHKCKNSLQHKKANNFTRYIERDFYKITSPITHKINELISLQVSLSQSDHSAAAKIFKTTSRNFYIFILFALIFSIPFGIYLIKNVQKLIADLGLSYKKQAESEAKFGVFFKHAGDAIFLLDETTGITEVNERACDLLGYTPKEFLKMKISDLFLPEDQQTFHLSFDKVKSVGGSMHERKWVKKNGQILNTEVNVRTVEGIGFISVVRDVTERDIAINKIKLSEERVVRMMQNSPIPLILMRLDNRSISYINLQVTNTFGYKLEDIPTAAIWWESAYPDSVYRDYIRTESLARVARAQTNNTPFEPIEALVTCKDGSKRFIEFHFANLGEEYLITCYDITARKHAEETVRKSEECNRALIENIDDAILLLNENHEIIYQSPSVERLNGYSIEDRKDLNIDTLIYPEDKQSFYQYLNTVYNTPGTTVQYQLRIKHKNGHTLWVEGTMINLLQNQSIRAVVVNYRDVTERKKATELFKYQFENSPDQILIINRDMTIESINHGQPNGLRADEIVGLNSITILPEESQEISRNAIIECFKTGKNQEIENSLVGNRWVRSRFVPIFIDGVITHIMVIATDITQQKLAEFRLKQSEEKHRALVENISDTIVLINESLEVLYLSPSFIRTSGFTPNEFEGKTAVDFIYPKDLQICFKAIEQAKINPGIPIPGQFRLLNKAGDYVWVEGTITNLLDNNSVKALVLNYRNITERKKMEEQQSLIAAIVNSSQDAIISKTLDSKITSWNSGAEKILGYSEAEMIGHSIIKIIPSFLIDEEQIIMDRIKAGKSVDHYETQRKRKDGELIPVSLTVSPIVDASGNVVGASKVIRDISEQKSMELERERILNDVQQRNRDLEQFSSIVSHNLRGPVATIMGLTSLLKTDDLEPKEKEDMIKGVSSAVTNLDVVIKDLNHILQIRREISEKREQIVFSALLESIQSELSNLIQKEQVKFVTDFSNVNSLRTIKSYIYSVFYNLISNSIKFKQPGVPPVIEISSFISENKIVLLFKDNGLGIDLNKKGDQVFGLYKRFHLNTEGKGIGLYGVKTQVESLGGAIFIQSKVNTGTEFRIEFENEIES